MSVAEHTEIMPVCNEKFENIENRINGLHDRHKERIDDNAKAIKKSEEDIKEQFDEFRKEVKTELRLISTLMVSVFVVVLAQALGIALFFLMRR